MIPSSSSETITPYQPNRAERSRCSDLCEYFTFPLQYLYSPTAVGTPFPCSSFVAREMLKNVLRHTSTEDAPRHFLEIGPGTGAITDIFIETMGPNDTLDLVECEEPFCVALALRYQHDPRISVHHKYIQEWNPPYKYDHVVTAVPLNALPTAELVRPILDSYRSLSIPNGTFSAVEYFGTTTAKRFCLWTDEKRRQFDEVQRLKVGFFNEFAVEERIVVRNMPPARVFHCVITDNGSENKD